VTDDRDEYEADVNDVTTVVSATTVIPTTPVTEFSDNYNGLSNVYIVSGKNVEINDMSDLPINGPTTFIVDGG